MLNFLESYILSRDVTKDYADLLRARIGRFVHWSGGLPMAELDCDRTNRFLAYLQTTSASPVTVDNYRRAILCIWRMAYTERENNNPPMRVRTIRRPRRLVVAFTQDEIRAILNVAERLGGYFPNGVRRSDFWLATIHAAYSTGLRRGDLLTIKKTDIRVDGVVQLLQSKTGYPIVIQLTDETTAAIKRMPIDEPRAFPWPYHDNALPRQFRELVKMASVRPGQFKWLRASAGSYAELEQPGNGSKMLGHRNPRVFHDHYEDRSITQTKPIRPPAIRCTGG